MSNDLILKQIAGELAQIQTGVDDDTRAVAGSGVGIKRISIKGGVFRKIAGGKEVGQIQDRFMDVIFVKMAHHPSRQYYEGAYVEGAKVAPACWSNDSKVPDPEVKFPVSKTCDKCPMSIKGSGKDGKGTACRLSWRTAVVLPNDPAGDVMQLVLPAASVFGNEESGKWPFRAYVQYLAGHNISAGKVITKMQFDTNAPAPRVLFSPVGAINAADVDTLAAQAKTPVADLCIKLTVYKADGDDEAEPASAEVAKPKGFAPVADTSVEEDSGEVETEAAVAEPEVRKTKGEAKTVEAPKDVSAIIDKWSKPKK